MQVKVNGNKMEVCEGVTIDALLDLLAVKRHGIAIDLNREIVPKRLLSTTILKDGDAVEIVRMVGGG